MAALDQFLGQSRAWSYEGQLDFAQWVLSASRGFSLPHSLLAQPLVAHFLVPTVKEWCALQPLEADPHLWLGLLGCDDPSEHLERALALDPRCELARRTLTQWILADVDYNQHELPQLYIHDSRDDLKDLERAERLLDDSEDASWATTTRAEIETSRAKADEWLRSHPREGDFASQ